MDKEYQEIIFYKGHQPEDAVNNLCFYLKNKLRKNNNNSSCKYKYTLFILYNSICFKII